MHSLKSRLAVLPAILALSCVSLFAQSTTSGEFDGTVYDASGATVPNATVVATNVATGVLTSTTTTSAGQYRLSNLPVGSYNLAVSAEGFNKAEIRNVTAELNKAATANFTLQVGRTAATTIDVSAAAATIDTTTAQLQNTFTSRQLADLPTASTGSGIINLSLLNAGVASSGAIGVGYGPSVGGQRPRNNNFTIEGIDNNDKSTTGPLVTVPNDAVAEFTVLQNQFSPEFGHSSGGQFNQVVKSGTNEFHGSLYEYFENRNMNAADNLDSVQGNPLHPRYDYNRFGGTFGGPIKRNKLFFFANYEYNPVGSTASTYYFAPTQTGYNTLASIPGVSPTNLSIFQKYLGVAPTVSPANQLPNGTPVTVGSRAIDVGQISSSLPKYTNYESGVGALDYNISDRDALRGRFILNRNGEIDTFGFPSTFFAIEPVNTYIVTASEYHTFTPNLTNEFRLGYTRFYQDVPTGGPQEKFPGLDQFPNLVIYELQAGIGPDSSAPQFTIQNTYQLTDNMNWTRGNHTFKFGFDGWKSISPSSFTQRARGDYEWNNFSDYLLDITPDYLAERTLGNVNYYGDQFLLGFYGNDSWKMRPNLTLNLGLRYEYQTLPYSERLQSVNNAASVPGVLSFNEPTTQNTAFMPRVGITYSPGTSGKTSIRSGFGINYDVLFDNLGSLSLPPQFNQTIDRNGTNEPGFLANGGIAPNSQLGSLSVADARAATSGFIPNQRRPKSIQWNLGIQHVFGENYTAEVRYLGSRGINLPVQQQINIQPVVNAQNALPVYTGAPGQAALDALPNTLEAMQSSFNNNGFLVPAYANAGFVSPITAFMPVGNSTYHGLATQLTRRFSNGLQFVGAYTWSHNIDDSTAEVASTVLTPRRAQNSQDLRAERASSALDHRQRLTFETIYDLPYFKDRNWFLKNLVGNWQIAPIYTYQTGTLYTVQSGLDSNLNRDSAGDRAIVNLDGNPALGSGTTPLLNSSGQTVAYQVVNPNAMYIATPAGALANAGRNTEHLNPINDVDLTLTKRFNITERYRLELSARAFNVFNHPQYVGGFLNDVQPITTYGPGTQGGTLALGSLVSEQRALRRSSLGIFEQSSLASDLSQVCILSNSQLVEFAKCRVPSGTRFFLPLLPLSKSTHERLPKAIHRLGTNEGRG